MISFPVNEDFVNVNTILPALLDDFLGDEIGTKTI